jgi:hypothetical protein
MLVYGDHKEIADPRERLEALAQELCSIAGMPCGSDRHARLVGALIDAGQLQQGLEDRGCGSPELSGFVYLLAGAVVRSTDGAHAKMGELPPVPRIRGSKRIELRLPEGFAFYAAYPEQFIVAARQLRLKGTPRVIGIRSIGTTLGAIVAATLGAPPPVTVRPFGDPFARQVELPLGIVDDAHYVIVDEGPGMSGSSFGAVADELELRGVPLDRIAFVPSHDGELVPQSSALHRKRWHKAQRAPAMFDPSFLSARFGPLEQFSTGGAWERLKFHAQHGGERVLLKFAGLGRVGAAKLEIARALHASGFTPAPIGLVHGFLVEQWIGDAVPLAVDEKPVLEIGRYIGARARLLRDDRASGASIDELLAMARRNICLSLGDAAATALDRCDARDLQSRVNRVRTDNKLDRQEWLRARDGHLIKMDALDHHCAHDLVGCQDVAWDIAGAIVEFQLSETEAGRLVAATGLDVDASLLEFYQIAYAAFRLGQAALAAQMTGTDPEGDTCRYRHLIKLLLQRTSCGTRQESLVD